MNLLVSTSVAAMEKRQDNPKKYHFAEVPTSTWAFSLLQSCGCRHQISDYATPTSDVRRPTLEARPCLQYSAASYWPRTRSTDACRPRKCGQPLTPQRRCVTRAARRMHVYSHRHFFVLELDNDVRQLLLSKWRGPKQLSSEFFRTGQVQHGSANVGS